MITGSGMWSAGYEHDLAMKSLLYHAYWEFSVEAIVGIHERYNSTNDDEICAEPYLGIGLKVEWSSAQTANELWTNSDSNGN